MRVGKKANVVEAKKTRSCVVRLEKLNSNKGNKKSSSSAKSSKRQSIISQPTSSRVTRLSLAGMGGTPKATLQDDKKYRGPLKKRPIGSSQSIQQQQQREEPNMSSNVRASQKVKIVQRIMKRSSEDHEESPPPTIAAGRSRRAIKPNPKYASEDLLTPKLIRNVGSFASGSKSLIGVTESKQRRISSSSDDFFNRDSSDEVDTAELNDEDDNASDDKAYQADEKEAVDSDFSEPERVPRPTRGRGRPRKVVPPETQGQLQAAAKSTAPIASVGRIAQTTITSVRSAPSHLQQIRRSLVTANAQRNLNMLGGQKRKLEDSTDNDGESRPTVARKQMIITSGGVRVSVPSRDTKDNSATLAASTSNTRIIRKILPASSQTLNGSKVVNAQASNVSLTSKQKKQFADTPKASTESRILIRSTPGKTAVSAANSDSKTVVSNAGSSISVATTQAKILAARATAAASKMRTGSPKPHNKDSPTTASSSNSSNNTSSPLTKPTIAAQLKKANITVSKVQNKNSQSDSNYMVASTSPATTTAFGEKTSPIATEESPNSTIDDFETMPTFTIVNVNDIINKKGDVLITKSKGIQQKTLSAITDDDDDDENGNKQDDDDVQEVSIKFSQSEKKSVESCEHKLSGLNRSTVDASRKSTTTTQPHILNHKLGLRNSRVGALTKSSTNILPDKPAPRILNAMVAKKTQPVKPLIANLDDSADESIPLSLDDTEDEAESKSREINKQLNVPIVNLGTEDSEPQVEREAQNRTSRNFTYLAKRKQQAAVKAPVAVGNKKRIMAAQSSTSTKENSLAVVNQQKVATKTSTPVLPRKLSPEKVVISRQGDKIIKKITCFETWYVINVTNDSLESPRPTRNQLNLPLIKLANASKGIPLPSISWSSKVTLQELPASTLAKSTFITYTGDLQEHNIAEEDRAKYQPSCVMFRRAVNDRQKSRLPYDRAVIFKNKTFFTNIEGKNVKLMAAPSAINSVDEIEILLQIVDVLTLQSEFVEQATTVQ
uniref:Uncharacterized protein n=1 Tax=Glossina palpalis gambiensis TaxID=67801 RepID=A0A1B0AUC1_9MUSC